MLVDGQRHHGNLAQSQMMSELSAVLFGRKQVQGSSIFIYDDGLHHKAKCKVLNVLS